MTETEREPPDSCFVPGMMHCAKCNFTLTRRTICAQSGDVGTGSNETETCPNGCGPLWPYTWRKLCDDFEKRFDQELVQRAEDDKTIKALAAALQKNYDTFCQYAKLHAAKDTDEGSEKAHRNLDLAAEIRKTLTDNAPRIKQAQEEKG